MSDKFALKLREVRMDLKRQGRIATQEEFGRIMGVTAQMVHKYERGLAEPGLEKVEALIKYYNLPISTFIAGAVEGGSARIEAPTDDTIPVFRWDSIRDEKFMATLLRFRDGDAGALEELTGIAQIPCPKEKHPCHIALEIAEALFSPVVLPGDTLVVSLTQEPKQGDVVLVRLHWEEMAILRRFEEMTDQGIILRGITDATPTVTIPPAERDRATVIGTVLELRRRKI